MDDTHDTTDISALAREVLAELEPGSYGDKFVLTRRQLFALSTGAISLGALGVAGVGNASAQSGIGQVGTEAEPVDVEGAQGNFSEGVTVGGALEAESVSTDSVTVTNDVNAGSVSTEKICDDRIYAGAFDGSSSDDRLDNALAEATQGDVIYLENATYNQDRIISGGFRLTGTVWDGGATIGAVWTLTNRSHLEYAIKGTGGEIVVDDVLCVINNVKGFDITVSADICLIHSTDLCDVIFDSGTSDGRFDVSTRGSATDNGTNSIGGIS